MPRVFIPQIVSRMTRASAEPYRMTPMHDFTDALRFGRLEYVLEEADDPRDIDSVMSKIRRIMDGFKSGDYLLAVGDPAIIAACSGIAFRNVDAVNVLRWDRKLHRYNPVTITL